MNRKLAVLPTFPNTPMLCSTIILSESARFPQRSPVLGLPSNPVPLIVSYVFPVAGIPIH